jgi:hypothetical protein
MSVRLMEQVWRECHVRPQAKYVLLCIADHARDDGTGANPGLTRIADRTGFSRRIIPKLVRELEADGFLIAHREPGRQTHYIVRPTGERPSLAALGNEASQLGNGAHPTREREVATREPRSPEPLEPLGEPSQPLVVAVHEELYGRAPSVTKGRWLASMEGKFGPDRVSIALRREYALDPDPKTICGRMERGLKLGDLVGAA